MLAKHGASVILGLTFFGVTFTGAFRPPKPDPVDTKMVARFQNVFAGFAYIGAYPCRDFEVPAHGVGREPAPAHFEPDKCYVFHLPASGSDAEPEQFVSRMRENQVAPVRFPKSNDDVLHPFSGGSVYRIDFRVDRFGGSVLCVQGAHGESPGADAWKPEDYLLVFSQR